jgi:tetratricopeptide (TPR) repeat protein
MSKILFLLVILEGVFLQIAFAQKSTELLSKAQKALDENKIQEAIQVATQVIEQEPQNAYAYYLRGLAKYAFSDFLASIADYSQAILLQPNYKEAFYNRGVSYFWLNQNENAENDFLKVLQIDSTNSRTYTALGSLYSRIAETETNRKKQKEFSQKAEKFYQKALQHNANYAPAYYNYALLISESHPKKSLELTEKYILLKSEDAQGYFLKGILLKNQKQPQEALNSFLQSAKLNAYNAETWLEVGNMYFLQKNIAEACTAWQKAEKLGSSEAKKILQKYCKNLKN